jgi:uncharacterized membrane protein (UPF0127 family)
VFNPRRFSLATLAPLLFASVIGCGGASVPAPTAPPESATASPTATPTPTIPPTPTPTPDERVASTFGLPVEELSVAVLTRGDGTSYELPLEVPPREEYSIGLSGRYQLEGRGMLFWYRELVRRPFWMKGTHIDLSIAFVDDDGVIVEILDMEAESEEFRVPGSFYRFAIEAPLGWYDERGLVAGDSAVLDFSIPESLRQ